MRSNTILATLLLATSSVCAQYLTPYDTISVVQVDSTSADVLHARAKRWFVDTFKDAKEVIQIEDPVERVIVGKGTTPIYWQGDSKDGHAKFTIEVSCKEGRYRARIYDVTHHGSPKVFGTSFYPATDLGTIYHSDTCYLPIPALSTDKAKVRAYKWACDHCKEKIWPQLRPSVELMFMTLELAMRYPGKAADPKKASDW